MAPGDRTKVERLAAIQARLAAADPASSHDEAFEMLTRTVNEYEEENSGRPYDPDGARLKDDGRIYPPRPDSEKTSTVPGARRYRTAGHNVWIAKNGAMLFVNIRTQLIDFSKAGADEQEIKI